MSGRCRSRSSNPPFAYGVAPRRQRAVRREHRQRRAQRAVFVEQLFGAIALEPLFELRQVRGILGQLRQRHLVRTPVAFGRQAVDRYRPGPAFRRTQHDHRPARPAFRIARARVVLNAVNLVERVAEHFRHPAMHGDGFRTFYVVRQVSVTFQQLIQFGFVHPRQQRGVRDLVAIQMQHRQHRTVAARIQELVGVPRRSERPGLRFAVADHAHDHQVRIVERRAVRVRQRIAEFAAFVNGSRRFGRDVTRDAARERELLEQLLHSSGVARDRRIHLAVRPL